MKRCFGAFTLIFWVIQSWGQTDPDFNIRPLMVAVAVENGPSLDGDVLNDPFWQSIQTKTQMTQVKPDNGKPASEKTEIRIAYTPKTFYLSIVCYDSDPGGLVVQTHGETLL